MIDFRYISAFVAVAESGSFSDAGKKLFIATSAVSRQIKLLEESCKRKLFIRSTRKVSLTNAGQKLFEEIQRFYSRSREWLTETSPRQIRIGTLQGVLHRWLIPIICKDQFFNELNIHLEIGTPDALVSGVEAGSFDVAFFTFATRTKVPQSVRVFKLFDENIVLISKERITLKDVQRYPWISLSKTSWLHRFTSNVQKQNIIVNDMLAAIELVKMGRGIAMVPEYAVLGVPGIYLQRVPKFKGATICLLVRKNRDNSPEVDAFLKLVKENSPLWG